MKHIIILMTLMASIQVHAANWRSCLLTLGATPITTKYVEIKREIRAPGVGGDKLYYPSFGLTQIWPTKVRDNLGLWFADLQGRSDGLRYPLVLAKNSALMGRKVRVTQLSKHQGVITEVVEAPTDHRLIGIRVELPDGLNVFLWEKDIEKIEIENETIEAKEVIGSFSTYRPISSLAYGDNVIMIEIINRNLGSASSKVTVGTVVDIKHKTRWKLEEDSRNALGRSLGLLPTKTIEVAIPTGEIQIIDGQRLEVILLQD